MNTENTLSKSLSLFPLTLMICCYQAGSNLSTYITMGRKSKRRFDCLQLNTHRAQLAHIKVLNLLNTKPDTLCLIQEPYAPQGKLVTKPVGMDVFPSGTNKVAPRAAIFAPRSLRARELPHLGNRDCAAATVSVGGSTVLLASVYLDITLPVCQTWLVDLLQYCLLYTSPSPRD